MRIGLACTGAGPAARYAYVLLQELENLSLYPEMVSCSSIPSIPLLLWDRGKTPEEIDDYMDAWESETPQKSDWGMRPLKRDTGKYDLAVNCVDPDTGATVIWTNAPIEANADNLKTYPLEGREREALESTVRPWYHMGGLEQGTPCLWDFACRYGCPFFPLKMAGMERLLSVVFTGYQGPQGIAVESLSRLTARRADCSLTIPPDSLNPGSGLRRILQAYLKELYTKLLF